VPETEPRASGDKNKQRARLATVFGWLAGGALGLVANYGIFLVAGDDYPTTWTTFALFLVGAFGGMALADRLGPRAFAPLGIAAGVMLALFIGIVLTIVLGQPSS
jgi:hypothetical protein